MVDKITTERRSENEAVRWLGREGVALYIMERSGEAFAVLVEAVERDARRRALTQFAAVTDPRKRLEIARKIVAAKLRTLNLASADAREFRAELAKARKHDDILIAASYDSVKL